MQKLKKAEEDAARIVDQARSQRAATLKKARADAEAEIKEYKEQLEKKLNEYKTSIAADSSKFEALETQASAAVTQLKADVQKNSNDIIERLLHVTTNVSLQVPEARKGVKSK